MSCRKRELRARGIDLSEAVFLERRVGGDEVEGFGEKGFSGFAVVPGGGSGRMGKGNEIKALSEDFGGKLASDDGVEAFAIGEELFDGEFSDRDEEAWLEEADFAFEPVAAVGDFVGKRNAVAAGRFFAGKTAANGGHVDGGAEFLLVDSAGGFEPAEKGFAGGPGERAAEFGFLVAGGLADEHDAAVDGASDDDGFVHGGAAVAGAEFGDVAGEEVLSVGHGEGKDEASGRGVKLAGRRLASVSGG